MHYVDVFTEMKHTLANLDSIFVIVISSSMLGYVLYCVLFEAW